MKEHRKLILVPRETPLSLTLMQNMGRAAESARHLPAMPGFYHGVKSIRDLVDFVVRRICDQLGIQNALIQRWGGEGKARAEAEGSADAEGVPCLSCLPPSAFHPPPSTLSCPTPLLMLRRIRQLLEMIRFSHTLFRAAVCVLGGGDGMAATAGPCRVSLARTCGAS